MLVRAPRRSCYVNIDFGAPLPAGGLAALCKVFDCRVSLAGLYNGMQTGLGRQSARRAGSGAKQKTMQALREARGGDFVLWGRAHLKGWNSSNCRVRSVRSCSR